MEAVQRVCGTEKVHEEACPHKDVLEVITDKEKSIISIFLITLAVSNKVNVDMWTL